MYIYILKNNNNGGHKNDLFLYIEETARCENSKSLSERRKRRLGEVRLRKWTYLTNPFVIEREFFDDLDN